MATETNDTLVKVFSGDRWQAELIKGLLEANGIQAMIKDETLALVTSPYSSVGGAVLVMVMDNQRDKALELIKENEEACPKERE